MTGVRPPAPVTVGCAAVILGVLVAGCTAVTTGTAAPENNAVQNTPQPGAQSSNNDATPGPVNNYGAPHVTTPLNTAKYQPDPCSALTPTQLTAIGIGVAGTVQQDEQGNVCHWDIADDTNYAFTFNLVFPAGEPLGLANAYQAAGPGALTRLPDVHGQPAVTEPSQNTDGECAIYLGATDEVEYAVSVIIGPEQPHYSDPCTVAQEIADDTTATMKSGG